MVEIPILTKRFFLCICGNEEEFFIEHLYEHGGSAGPWYCHACGQGYRIAMSGGVASITLADKREPVVTVIARLLPQEAPIHLFVDYHGGSDSENARYWLEEHACAANVIGAASEMIVGDDADRHRVFEFIATMKRFPQMRGHMITNAVEYLREHEPEVYRRMVTNE